MGEHVSPREAREERGWSLALHRYEETIVARERERHTRVLADHEQEIRARERRRIGALLAPPIWSSDFAGCTE